jgi:DNA-binding response OmpR family regulator
MAHDILVVDDDVEMLRMLSLVLGEEGYGVRVARSTVEAMRLAEERKPDLVLMDLMLPMEAGIGMAEELKLGACSEVPIIAMSSADPMIARGRAQACFEGWLPKPFSLGTLLHFVGLAGDS